MSHRLEARFKVYQWLTCPRVFYSPPLFFSFYRPPHVGTRVTGPTFPLILVPTFSRSWPPLSPLLLSLIQPGLFITNAYDVYALFSLLLHPFRNNPSRNRERWMRFRIWVIFFFLFFFFAPSSCCLTSRSREEEILFIITRKLLKLRIK